jgi:hypothetical protein
MMRLKRAAHCTRWRESVNRDSLSLLMEIHRMTQLTSTQFRSPQAALTLPCPRLCRTRCARYAANDQNSFPSDIFTFVMYPPSPAFTESGRLGGRKLRARKIRDHPSTSCGRWISVVTTCPLLPRRFSDEIVVLEPTIRGAAHERRERQRQSA